MKTDDPQSDLWAALGRDVAQRATRPPQIAYQDVSPPRADVDRLLGACASGYLPVLSLCVLWTFQLCWSWSKDVPSIFSLRMLLMLIWGAAISWVVYPVLYSGRTLKPLRLVPVALALIWVMPLVELPLCWMRSWPLDWAMRRMGTDLLFATHPWVLVQALVVWAAGIAAFRRLQRRFPWHDPVAPRRNRMAVAYAALLLPLLANLVAATWIQLSVPSSIALWEARFVRENGQVGGALPAAGNPWFDLVLKSYKLSDPGGAELVHDTEREALETLKLQPPGRNEDDAPRVFERLLLQGNRLQDPTGCQLALVECRLRTFAAVNLDPFDRTMEAYLDTENLSKEELESMASRMRQLANQCPTTAEEIDDRLYRKRFRERDFLLSLKTLCSPLLAVGSPSVLYDAIATRQETEAWLRTRPSLPGNLAQPNPTLEAITAEAGLKPRLRLYEVICELRAFRMLRGQYPDHLGALRGLSEADLARFQFTSDGVEAHRVDLHHLAPSSRNEQPRSEWALK